MQVMNEYDQYYYNELDRVFDSNNEQYANGLYYTEDDYAALQENIANYKNGSREAGTYIIKVFHPFIKKYARFITYGDLPYSTGVNKNGTEFRKVSQTIASFVSLFMEKTDEPIDKKKNFSMTCVRIKKLFSKYEYFDIYNELILALLNMANKYKIITDVNNPHYKKNGTFHMYVSKCFHWEAFRFLTKLIKDPLTHCELLYIHESFDDIDDEILDEGNDIVLVDDSADIRMEEMIDRLDHEWKLSHSNKLTQKENNYDTNDMSSLNFNWVQGITCGDLFNDLTPYEREIMVYSFVEKKTIKQISEIYGCSTAMIHQHKKRAIEKLQAKAIEQKRLKKG